MSVNAVRHLPARLLLLASVLSLAACAGRIEQPRPQPTPLPPVVQPPETRVPATRIPIQAPPTRTPAAVQRSHPRYAPPPGAPAHWNNQLGVYVVEGSDLYYRERLYYRWDGDWYCAGRPDGPWEPVELHSVPPGLRGRHR
ncbi:hypothetical protein [Pseudomonas mangrovi]|uniref:Lipoprotein n=1 Tax=Pseudomonas mangrovi TaxID=2161748 RepID=A0A2T5P6E2_9PSED|nr:hypothetical protein [Pseudomonas mangrovi]PTU73318.1 hypothetical protein DBO85_13320 [Pseudomonas mangrovi]